MKSICENDRIVRLIRHNTRQSEFRLAEICPDTHTWRRVRHWLTAVSMKCWSSSSHASRMRSRGSSTSLSRCWWIIPAWSSKLSSPLDLDADSLMARVWVECSSGVLCQQLILRPLKKHRQLTKGLLEASHVTFTQLSQGKRSTLAVKSTLPVNCWRV